MAVLSMLALLALFAVATCKALPAGKQAGSMSSECASGAKSDTSGSRGQQGPSFIQRNTGSDLRLKLRGEGDCTTHHHDPFWEGAPCCDGLKQCLGFWSRHWHYLCLHTCPGDTTTTTTTTRKPACTFAGNDPWSTGTEVPCCQGLESCLGNWKGYFHYYCLASCDPSTTTASATATPTTTTTTTSEAVTTVTTTPAISTTSKTTTVSLATTRTTTTIIEVATTATATPAILTTSETTTAATTSTTTITTFPWPTTTTTTCASKGHKPISTGQCCTGLSSCLGDWNANGRWHFQCLESCSSSPCTVKGEDPFDTGREMPCCKGLSACKLDWVGDGQEHHVCLESCKDVVTTTTTTTIDYKYVGSALCGIAVNHGTCAQELEYLSTLDARATGIRCLGYGGKHDPCHLSITNDRNFGMDKDPSKCFQDVFFLWDEPDTQCQRGEASCGANWASSRWKRYVDTWKHELKAARARGMMITSPLMKSGDESALLMQYKTFFDGCGPECLDPESPYYINALAWNAFCTQKPPSQYEVGSQFSYLKTLAAALKREYPMHSVLATNFGLLSAHAAADQAAAMTGYGMLDAKASPIDGVFYFAAQDYCGKPNAWECTSNNFLSSVVESGPHQGKSLGQVLIETCFP